METKHVFFKPLHADSGLDSFNPFSTGIDMPVVLWSCFSMSFIFLLKVRTPKFLGGAGRPKKGNRVAKAVFSNLPWHQENSRHPTTQEQVTVLAHGAVEEKEFVFTTSPKESEWEHVHRDIIKFI